MPQNFVSRYNNLLAVKGRGGIEYTAGPNIDISDYIISGRDWTSDIDSAIQSVKGSGFSAATAWVDSQGYLTAHQDVDNLPYVQNSALEFYGAHISGISGSGLYALSAEGAFNAETANFAYNSESAESAGYAESAGTTDSANYALTAFFANSATSSLMADTAVYAYTADKADDLTNWTYTDSAMTGIKGYNGTAFISQDLQYWDYTDSAQTAISGYNGTAFLGEDGNCPWISGNKVIGAITADFGNTVQVISSFDFSGNKNHYISLKGFNLTLPSTANIASALDQKFDTSSFNTFIENGFNPNMTQLHGATAYLSAFVNTGCVHNSALSSTDGGLISSISGSGFYAYGGGDTTPWISGDKQIDTELALQFGQSIQVLSSFTVSGDRNHAIAVKGSIIKMPTTANIADALMEKLDISTFSSFSSTADVTPYTAGANIDITNHVVSGRDWLPLIESGDSGKLDITAFTAYTATAIAGDYELSAGPGISITDYPEDQKTVIAVTAGGGGGAVYSAGQYIDIDPSNYISVTGLSAYTAGSNINITNNVISGKSWTNDITAASSYAYNQATANAQGKTYTGVAPIVVNNVEDKISADTMQLIAGSGISFDTTLTSTTINCTITGGGSVMNVTDGTSSYSALGFYDQVNDTGCYQIMGTAVDGTTPGHSFGYTLPMQSRIFSADCVDSAKNYTDAEISAHIKYVSYGALAGGTVSFADVRSAIVNGGIVIPYEVKLPGNNYFVYNYSKSGIDNLTTGYEFTRVDGGGNYITLTVSSYNNGATTGCVTASTKAYATPSDVALVDRIVLVATSGAIPASGASDNKVYIVTGS